MQMKFILISFVLQLQLSILSINLDYMLGSVHQAPYVVVYII